MYSQHPLRWKTVSDTLPTTGIATLFGSQENHQNIVDDPTSAHSINPWEEPMERDEQRRARHVVQVSLTDEEMAALVGWRASHGVDSDSEALRQLLRHGLLCEVGRVFRALDTPKTARRTRRRSHGKLMPSA